MILDKIKVAGIDYEVEEVDVVILEGNTNYAGSCLYIESKIELLKDLPITKKEQTLVHEIIHACLFEAGFNEHDEYLVNRLGIVLYQVLKDNNLNFCDERRNTHAEKV